MKKNKKVLAAIFMLIEIVFLSNLAYSEGTFLRVPLITNKKYIEIVKENKVSVRQTEELYARKFEEVLLKILNPLSFGKHEIEVPKFRCELGFYMPDCDNNRRDLAIHVVRELGKNLLSNSKSEREILLQHIYYDNHKAIRIISRNRETIETPIEYLLDKKMKIDPFAFDELSGAALYWLKEFAHINKGIFFTLDSNGQKMEVSYDNIVESKGNYKGTEIQMIIFTPAIAKNTFSLNDIKNITRRAL
ncbi:hypothetical protein ACFL2G_00715 [Candidatus Omnitrophota bacterium]